MIMAGCLACGGPWNFTRSGSSVAFSALSKSSPLLTPSAHSCSTQGAATLEIAMGIYSE